MSWGCSLELRPQKGIISQSVCQEDLFPHCNCYNLNWCILCNLFIDVQQKVFIKLHTRNLIRWGDESLLQCVHFARALYCMVSCTKLANIRDSRDCLGLHCFQGNTCQSCFMVTKKVKYVKQSFSQWTVSWQTYPTTYNLSEQLQITTFDMWVCVRYKIPWAQQTVLRLQGQTEIYMKICIT